MTITEFPAQPRRYQLLLAGIVALYLGHVLLLGYVSDDGYIALRYVRNFLAGQGFVYNPGEHVEGYTSFVWVALLGALGRVLPGVALETLAKVVGVVFGVAAVAATAVATRRLWPNRGWTSLAAATLVAASTGLAAWATGGLETTLFALTVILAAWAYLADLEAGRHPVAVGALLGLMAMTRPDGMVLAAAAGAHYAVHAWRTARLAGLGRVALLALLALVVLRLAAAEHLLCQGRQRRCAVPARAALRHRVRPIQWCRSLVPACTGTPGPPPGSAP